MKIKYEFLEGQAVEIDVDDVWAEVIIQYERDNYNSDRRETRRHKSYSDDNDKVDILVDPSADVELEALHRQDNQRLCDAISTLLPQQQELVYQIYVLGEKIVDVARREGVTEGAIRDRLRKIHARLKKILE